MSKRIIIKKFKKSNRKDSNWYRMKCLKCGKFFDIIGRDYNRGRGIYCNDKCNLNRKDGEYNGMWKGGIKKSKGYLYLHKSLVEKKYHYLATNAKFYIPEHRLIASKKYKKQLTSKDIVHHLNGIRDDNRTENLVIVDSSKHERHTLERLLKKRIKELESAK